MQYQKCTFWNPQNCMILKSASKNEHYCQNAKQFRLQRADLCYKAFS